MNEPTKAVERVFNLGDYKSFRSKVNDGSEQPLSERTATMINLVCDAQKQFLFNQLVEARLYESSSEEEYVSKIEDLEEIREEMLEEWR